MLSTSYRRSNLSLEILTCVGMNIDKRDKMEFIPPLYCIFLKKEILVIPNGLHSKYLSVPMKLHSSVFMRFQLIHTLVVCGTQREVELSAECSKYTRSPR